MRTALAFYEDDEDPREALIVVTETATSSTTLTPYIEWRVV